MKAMVFDNRTMASFISNDKESGLSHRTEEVLAPSRPVISEEKVNPLEFKAICPTHAIGINPARIDLAKCRFCGECEKAFPHKVQFTDDFFVASNVRDRLPIIEGDLSPIRFDIVRLREDLNLEAAKPLSLFVIGSANKIVQMPVGVRLAQTPAEANGILIISAITEETENQIEQAYAQLRKPRLVGVSGHEALGSEVFNNAGSKIKNKIQVDLFIPGDPCHPITIAAAFRQLRQEIKSIENSKSL